VSTELCCIEVLETKNRISFIAANPQTTETDVPTSTTSATKSSLRPEEIVAATPYIPRGTETSVLSTFLIPGGQVPVSGPVVHLRPPGRSTITKVASPHLYAEQSREESKIAGAAQRSAEAVDKSTTEVFVIDDGTKLIDDSPFNWYFQHYNDTNLEPFVGIAYSGAAKIGWSAKIGSFLFVLNILL